MKISKRDPIGSVRGGDGIEVDLMDLDTVTDQTAILGLMPKNTEGGWSEGEWILYTRFRGVVVAWSKCCIMWHQRHHEHLIRREAEILAKPEVAGNMRRCQAELTFGEAGIEAFEATGGDWKRMTDYLCGPSRQWKLDKFGSYGEWFMGAEINPIFLHQALRTYMED